MILAIDPGNIQSAVLEWDGKEIRYNAILPNEYILTSTLYMTPATVLVVEQVRCMGMAVGASVLDTVFWSGRCCQQWNQARNESFKLVPRSEIKMYLCGSMRAKDSNIRQVLIDRFGKPGTKKKPGLTYGISKDLWAAFALAVTFWDNREIGEGE